MDIIETKLVILGSQGVGKTCFVRRYKDGNAFDCNPSPTIGASYIPCDITINDKLLRLQVWDTAGQERFISMAPIYYRNSEAAIIMFDITNEQSFLSLELWIKQLLKNVDNTEVICLVGNKCDLETDRRVSRECANKYAQRYNAQYFEVSAFADIGVNAVFTHIATKLFESSERTIKANLSTSDSDFSVVNTVELTNSCSTKCKTNFCCF